MVPIIIGIDHGYYAVKTRHFVLPAGIVAYDYEPYTRQDVLEYGGKFYVCGSGRQPLVRDKLSDDNYYLLTLAAIAKELQKAGKEQASVLLAAGLPLTGFGRAKTSFREYLLRSPQPVCFRYEKKSYEVRIEGVDLSPQGYSALAAYPQLITREPSVLLCDIGGWTVDMMRLDDGVPNAATCRSLEMGVIRCIDEVLEQVRRNTGLSITEAQAERVLVGKPCSLDEQAVKIVREQGRQYVKKLLSAVMESGFDAKAVPILFIGGGAVIARRFVRPCDRLCQPVYLDDVHANAIGYERIAGQRAAQKGKSEA